MKSIIYTILCLSLSMISFSSHAQESLDRLARVQKLLGVEVYFMSEPLRTYEVVLDKGTGFNAGSYFTAGLVNESVATKASKFVKRAIEEGKKQGKEFDAIIYNSGKSVVAVKFTEEATLANKGIGRVQLIDNIQIYVLCEPLKGYKMVNKKNGGLKGKSLLTAGLINNSIEQDIAKMTRRLVNNATLKSKKIEAVVYSAGKTAIGVEFEE